MYIGGHTFIYTIHSFRCFWDEAGFEAQGVSTGSGINAIVKNSESYFIYQGN